MIYSKTSSFDECGKLSSEAAATRLEFLLIHLRNMIDFAIFHGNDLLRVASCFLKGSTKIFKVEWKFYYL